MKYVYGLCVLVALVVPPVSAQSFNVSGKGSSVPAIATSKAEILVARTKKLKGTVAELELAKQMVVERADSSGHVRRFESFVKIPRGRYYNLRIIARVPLLICTAINGLDEGGRVQIDGGMGDLADYRTWNAAGGKCHVASPNDTSAFTFLLYEVFGGSPEIVVAQPRAVVALFEPNAPLQLALPGNKPILASVVATFEFKEKY